MNYLITAAGKGSRFLNCGIKPPKPLIKVAGNELLLWTLESFRFESNDSLYIITLKHHKVKERLEKKINFLLQSIQVSWLELDTETDGQLKTAIKAIKYFNISGQLLIHNCDTYYKAEIDLFQKLLIKNNSFGLIPCFQGKGNHWSFAKTLPEDPTIAIEVAEKSRISSNCSVGSYLFASAEVLLSISNEYIATRKEDSGEYFIAPLYQYALSKGMRVSVSEAKDVRLFGTPEELMQSFNISFNEILGENAWYAHQIGTLVVDIDGTLCGPSFKGDYTLVKPLSQVCNALRKANKLGLYIILFTSRNMRSFKGSLGLINKYTSPILLDWLLQNDIPFDEIYFGKPWGEDISYIDDKAISIGDFIKKYP